MPCLFYEIFLKYRQLGKLGIKALKTPMLRQLNMEMVLARRYVFGFIFINYHWLGMNS